MMTEEQQFLRTLLRRSLCWSTITRFGRNRLLQTSFIWFLFVPIAIRLLKFAHQHVIHRVRGFIEALHDPTYKTQEVLTAIVRRLQASSLIGEEGVEELEKKAIEIIRQLEGLDAWIIKSFGDDFTIPLTWKMFYLAAVCVALATTIYTVLCPPIIKFYRDASDYIEKSGNSGSFLIHHLDVLLPRDETFFTPYGTPTIISKDRVLNVFLLRFVDPVLHDEINGNFKDRQTAYSYTELKPSCINHVGEAYWFVRFVADWTLPVARLVCSLLYLVALGCVGIVLIENFVFVIKHWFSIEENTLRAISYPVSFGFFIFVGLYLFIKTSYRRATTHRTDGNGDPNVPHEDIDQPQKDTSTESSRQSQDDHSSGPHVETT